MANALIQTISSATVFGYFHFSQHITEVVFSDRPTDNIKEEE